jgi:hypothetical protein
MRKPIVVTRRAALVSATTALLGGGALAFVGLGAASDQQPRPQTAVVAFADNVTSDGPNNVFVYSSTAVGGKPAGIEDFEARQKKYLDTLAGKLGTTADKLRTAMEETSKAVGLPGPFPMAGTGGVHFELSMGSDLAAVAQALGMTEADLTKALDNASMADVAKAHGVDRQVVATALKNAHTAAIDKAVKDGKLPTTIADKLKSNVDEEVQMLIDMKHGPGGAAFGKAVHLQHSED